MDTVLFALPIISVLALGFSRLFELGAKRKTIRGPIKEKLTLRLFILVGAIVAFGSIGEYAYVGREFSWEAFWLGWIIGLTSFRVREAAISALGRFWSLHVEIRENHEFIRSGPFRMMRHPVYFSMILELLAFTLVCQAWFTAICVPLLFIPVLWRRVYLEERALIDKFGEGYREYKRTTPALFPLPW